MTIRSTLLTAALIFAALLGSAAQASAAKYSGKTEEGVTVKLKRSGKYVTGINTLVNVVCTSPNTSIPTSGAEFYRPPGRQKLGRTTKSSEQQPSAVAPGEPTKNYTVRVREKGKRISGKLQINFSYYYADLYNPRIYYCVGSTDFKASRV